MVIFCYQRHSLLLIKLFLCKEYIRFVYIIKLPFIIES